MGKKPKTYTVERLLATRETADGREYLVHWADYSSAHDSWEPEENIIDQELIDEFHEGVCGTFGCTLPDKHAGLHVVPDFGARKRKRSSEEPAEAPGKQQQQRPSHKPDGKSKAGSSSEAALPAATAKLLGQRPKLGGETSGKSEVSIGPHYQARITEFIGPTADSDCGAARPEPVAVPRRQLDLEVARSTAAALTLSAFGEDNPWVFVAPSSRGLGLFARTSLKAGQASCRASPCYHALLPRLATTPCLAATPYLITSPLPRYRPLPGAGRVLRAAPAHSDARPAQEGIRATDPRHQALRRRQLGALDRRRPARAGGLRARLLYCPSGAARRG